MTDSRVEINGLAWQAENGGELIRFPARLRSVLPKTVWGLAQSPSGGRLRFRTDSNRLEYLSPPASRNMHSFGQTGVGRRELVSAKAIGPLSGAAGQAAPGQQRL